MSERLIEVVGGKYGVMLRDDRASARTRWGEDRGLPTNTEHALACEVSRLRDQIAGLRRQRDELHETTNRYLERARTAEYALDEIRIVTAPENGQTDSAARWTAHQIALKPAARAPRQ